jgi:glycosyltransferase involved in cell wall biosynthesis
VWLYYQRLAHVAKSFERRHLAPGWYSKHPALRTAATSPTWVTPRELLIEVGVGAFRRVFDFSRRRPSSPTFACPFDPCFSTLFVIPVIAPGQCIRSIKLGVLGKGRKRDRLPIELAKTPTGQRVIDGFAAYEPHYNQLIWNVPGGVFETGRQYFMRLSPDHFNGLALPATDFDPAALISRPAVLIVADTATAIPSLRIDEHDRKRTISVLLDFSQSPSDGLPHDFVKASRLLFPESELNVIDARQSTHSAFDIITRSQNIFVDFNLLAGEALGMSTLDLLRVLHIHGARLTLLSRGGKTATSIRSDLAKHDQVQEILPLFSSAITAAAEGEQQQVVHASHLQHIPPKRGNEHVSMQQIALQPTKLSVRASQLLMPKKLLHVAIVTIVYKQISSLPSFLDCVYRQSYPGPITIVIVDDSADQYTFREVEAEIAKTSEVLPPRINLQTVRNPENLGNCNSRNVGISRCSAADICIFIDADCLMNGHFVQAHVSQYLTVQADAVVGQYNIESNDEPGELMLRRLESDPHEVARLANLQDNLNPAAFVNTVTRNLSISKSWLDTHGGFDSLLSYSARSDTGYGWEDVEIGARLYQAGGRICYTEHAFSVHLSHPASQPSGKLACGSATNFRRLANKHEIIRLAARRWYMQTAHAIVEWGRAAKATSSDLLALESELKSLTSTAKVRPFSCHVRKGARRLRVLTHRWHVPHQYELHKLPMDFTLVTGTGTAFTNTWDYERRPLRPNVRFAPLEGIRISKFDLAIVHFDENVLCTELSNGVLSPDWGATFRWFCDHVKVPMIAVCHGTVPFVGQYGANPNAIDKFEIYEANADQLRRKLSEVPVVVNSHQAANEWQFKHMRVIWHGYDPQEFRCGKHDLDIVSHGADPYRPHYRGMHQFRAVVERLAPGIRVSTHAHQAYVPVPSTDSRFATCNFESWVEHLGRHKAYLNTTMRSPMPRTRTEAMLCGVVPVSLDNHDVSLFIKNGINGFYSSFVEELADHCNFICRNKNSWEKMSAMARSTAMDIFNHDRYLNEWMSLITDTLGQRADSLLAG